MDFDNLPENLQLKWWEGARDNWSKLPLASLRLHELQAVVWYWNRIMDGWEHESPQSYDEALMWHEQNNNIAQARLELAKRAAVSAEKGLTEWRAKYQKPSIAKSLTGE